MIRGSIVRVQFSETRRRWGVLITDPGAAVASNGQLGVALLSARPNPCAASVPVRATQENGLPMDQSWNAAAYEITGVSTTSIIGRTTEVSEAEFASILLLLKSFFGV